MALSFDFYNSIIEVPLPDTTLTMQDLINQIRDQEDELELGLNFTKIADASGKDDLGGGISTGITVRLLDNWQVRFAERPGPSTVQCFLTGGNLVGGPSGNPIAASAYVQVVQQSSASGTIATSTGSSENTNLKYLLASMREDQKTVGGIFYWDPTSGSDSNTGLAPSSAVLTFDKAQTLATAGKHDIIFCLSTHSSGITTVTETLNITKSTLKVRGPGYVFQLIPNATTDPTITIAADSVEINGLYVGTAATGSQDAITVQGDYVTIKESWIANARGNGIEISNSINPKVISCVIESSGGSGTGDGIHIGDSTTQAQIAKGIIFNNVNGVSLSGTSLADNRIEDSLIYKNSAYGLTIGSDVLRTIARSGNTITNNTTANTLDAGTQSYIESQAGGASASEIADAVWDEVLAGHISAGTMGRALKDTKTRATLASLK
jgi:hypothetical protein